MQGKLTPKQRKAAVLLAQGQTQESVAAAVGVEWSTLWRWQKRAEFVAAVDAEAAIIRERLRAEGIANRQNRIDAVNARWQGLRQVIAERAADPALADVPGGTTGLVVAKPLLVKVYQEAPLTFGGGASDEPFTRLDDRAYLDPVRRSVLAYEYSVDTATLKEMREHEKQAAIEMGQWTEKREEKHDLSEFLAALREFGRGDGDGSDAGEDGGSSNGGRTDG